MWHGGWHGHGGLDDEELGQIYNPQVVKRLVPYFRAKLGLLLLAVLAMLLYTLPWLPFHG